MANIERGVNLELPKLKFFYVEHSPEMADGLWEQIRDCDVVLLESVGPKEKKDIQEIEIGLAIRFPETKGSQIILRGYSAGAKENFGAAIMAKCIKEGKEFHSIDISDDSEAYPILDQVHIKRKEALMLLNKGNLDMALEIYKDSLKSGARAAKIREATVLNQLIDFQSFKGEEWYEKSIAIIQGASHSPTYHAYRRLVENQKTEKIMPTKKYLFDPEAEIIRKMQLMPEKPISEIEYKQAFLAMFIIVRSLSGRPLTSQRYRQLTAIARKLTAHDVENYWAKLKNFRFNYKYSILRISRQIVQNSGLK